MKCFKIIFHCLLLFAIPAIAVHPPADPVISIVDQEVDPELYNLTYDQIIDLLDRLENDQLEELYSPEALERVNQLVANLAREGLIASGEDEGLLDYDIYTFLEQDESIFRYASLQPVDEYFIAPSILNDSWEVIQCKGWFKKQYENTKKFVKKHKTAIIVGAAIVVATVIVIGVIAATTAGAAAAAHQANLNRDNKPVDTAQLKAAIKEEILAFNNTVIKDELIQPQEDNFPIEENGRILGQALAHQSLDHLIQQTYNPIQNPQSNYHKQLAEGHDRIDKMFAPDYLVPIQQFDPNLSASFYQLKGERALELQDYDQAILDFGKTIELSPDNFEAYRERATAHLQVGDYEKFLSDYEQYTVIKPTSFEKVTKFSYGFAKGLPRGIYDSGEGLVLLANDLVRHPIRTGEQIYEGLTILANLARTAQWDALSEVLAPEIRQLVKEWDTIPLDRRGELAGYAFGKYGSDILISGASLKLASKGVKCTRQLNRVYKNLQTAEKTLLLESIAGVESGAKIGEVVRASHTTIALGEELGYSAHEMMKLKQAGKLEGAINNGLDRLVSQAESEAFKTAISQNKHVKMVRDYLDKPAKEIQKGVNSYEKQIAIHKDKIMNPTKYYPDWDKLDPRQREALINKKWPTEIKGYEEQRSVLQSILHERLSHE